MDAFDAQRPRLFALAYRMLGTRADADDLVHECWLRWNAADRGAIDNPAAWLTTVMARLCLDQRKSARARREAYVGPWLPEPLPTEDDAPVDERAAMAESVSVAFLVVLESLSPTERAVLVLHDVFEHEHEEIAAMLDRSVASCRQSLHRARERLRARSPRFAPTPREHADVVGAFARCVATGDVAALTALLSPDAVVLSDSDGKARAARKPVHGADRCARLLVGLARKGGVGETELRVLNGALSFVVREGAVVTSMLSLETDGHVIYAVHIQRNPVKLARLSQPVSPSTT